MASLNRTLAPLEAVDRGVVLVTLTFKPNGASAPATSSFKGALLSTVTHSATGVWAVTLTDGAYALLGAYAAAECGATSTTLSACTKNVDVNAKTLTVHLLSGGSLSDGNTDDKIHVLLAVQKTSTTTRRS